MATSDEKSGTRTYIDYYPSQTDSTYLLDYATIIQYGDTGNAFKIEIRTYNDGTNDHNQRALIKFKLPPEPSPGSKIDRVILYLTQVSGTSDDSIQYVHVHPVTSKGWHSPTWTNVKWNNTWADGGDYDSSTNYGFGADGVVDVVQVIMAPPNVDAYDLTPLVESSNLSWGDWVNILIRFRTESSTTDYIIEYATDTYPTESYRPKVRVYYYDPYPGAVSDLKVKPYESDPTKPSFNWTAPKDEDLSGGRIYDDTAGSYVQTNRSDSVSPYTFEDTNGDDDYNKPTYLLSPPSENTITKYHLEMVDSVGGTSVSNTVKVVRPTVDTVVIPTGKAVGDVVDLFVLAKGSRTTADDLKDMELGIAWGDGTEADRVPHHQATISSVSGNAITVDDTTGFEQGEKIILYNGTDTETAEVMSVSDTVIYTTSSLSLIYASGDHVVTDHRHVYSNSGTHNISIRAYNDEGFASDYAVNSITISTASPTAKVSITPMEISDGDTYYISLSESIAPDGNDSVTEYGIAIPYNGGTALYSDLTPSSIFVRKATTLSQPVAASRIVWRSSGGTSDTRTAWVYGSDGTSDVVEAITVNTATTTTFTEVYSVAFDYASSSYDVTVEDLGSNVLATLPSGYTDAFGGYDIEIGGYIKTSVSDWDTVTVSYNPAYYIDLLSELADGLESIDIPNKRDYKLSEGWRAKIFKIGTERAKVLKLGGTAVTQSGYTSCQLSEGSVTFSGSGGSEYDDVLLMDAILSQGDHKVKINYNGREYIGWLVEFNYTVTAGLSYQSWSATVVVV